MKKISLIILLFCGMLQCLHAQKKVKGAEYFWDTDPGEGHAHSLAVSTPKDSVHISANISTTGLQGGFHNLYMRVYDDSGRWSLPEQANVYIYQTAATTPPNITAAEYFWDADPGEGLGHVITVALAADSVKITSGIPTSGLKAGFHVIYVRTRDSKGSWSLVEQQQVYVSSASANTLPNTTAAEYFWDTDPGQGKGHSVSVGTAADSIHFAANIGVTIPVGFHQLYFRTKDAHNSWSLVEQQTVYVTKVTATQDSLINAAEYFIDTDPGEGKGAKITIAHPADSVTQAFNVTIPANIDTGYHLIYVRTRTSGGLWGITDAAQIHIGKALPVSLLYFRANLNNSKTDISWGTTTEINTAMFEVQRSLNGLSFATFATLQAAGNSTTAKYYSITDDKPPYGSIYYRLREVDKDGKSTYSLVIKLDNNGQLQASVSPNPARNNLHIVLPFYMQAKAIVIYNSIGQAVMQKQVVPTTESTDINITSMAVGEYYIHIISKDGTSHTLNFTKQ